MMLKNGKGISLIALVVTIIVLLILAGISLIILQTTMLNQAELSANKTFEGFLQEQIEFAWQETEASYWKEAAYNQEIDKKDYFKENFKKNLENAADLSNIKITGDIEKAVKVRLEYKSREYTFLVSQENGADLLYVLKGNVKVGDYLEYPVEYEDVYSGEKYTTSNGWRVIDDGVMNGTSGTVRLVSTGVPAKWYYYVGNTHENNAVAINELKNNFKNTALLLYNKQSKKVNVPATGQIFEIPSISKGITILSLSDINYAYNEIYKTNRAENDDKNLEKSNDLFCMTSLDAEYWLATSKVGSTSEIYYMWQNEIEPDFELKIGIRPVISLDKKQTGIRNSSVWKLIDLEEEE